MSAVLLDAKVSNDSGQTLDVKLTSRTILRWEKQFPGRSVSLLETKLTYVYEAVFVAVQAQLPGLTFGDFCDQYDIDVSGSDTEATDPTPATV